MRPVWVQAHSRNQTARGLRFMLKTAAQLRRQPAQKRNGHRLVPTPIDATVLRSSMRFRVLKSVRLQAGFHIVLLAVLAIGVNINLSRPVFRR